MTNTFNNNRKDTASKIINASPQKIYEALTSPEAIAAWKPPGDMTCRIYEFNPEEGGTYRMTFIYPEADSHTATFPTSLALSLIDYFLILNFKYELPCYTTRIFTADNSLPVSRIKNRSNR